MLARSWNWEIDDEYTSEVIEKKYNITEKYKILVKSCPNLNNIKKKCISSYNKTNILKNRYYDVPALDKTRFKLKNIKNDYINANIIEIIYQDIIFNYISTQAPKYNTCRDFWKMVWDSKSSVIIMLTDFIESGKYKSSQYWPMTNDNVYTYWKNETKNSKNITLTITLENTVNLEIATLNIINLSCDTDTRKIYHIQYRDWGDHKQPSSVKDINLLIDYMEIFNLFGTLVELYGPPIIHCSAGIGRSGTFIGCSILKKLILTKRTNFKVNEIIRQMRRCRYKMVQTNEQYTFLYHFIETLVNK